MKRKILFIFFVTSILYSQSASLKSTINQYDYVIITIDDLIETCESFKAHKESFNNFSVLITTKNEILEEFNSDSTTQENIRDFISYAGNNWVEPIPRYFLFAADLDSIPNFSFQSVSDVFDIDDTSHSDYYYGIDTSESYPEVLSYSIGRIAAENQTELSNYFNKIIDYENTQEIEQWNNKSLFITDDQYGRDSSFEGNLFTQIAFSISNFLPEFITKDFVIPIDTSQFYGKRDSIITKINSGQSSIFFSGHSNNKVFTHDSIFAIGDVDEIENRGTPFFISMMGKQSFQRNSINSIMNKLITSQNGAIAGINSVGVHFVSQGTSIYSRIWSEMYNNKSIGEIFVDAMNESGNTDEKRKYNIFGDPSLTLKADIPADIDDQSSQIPNFYSLEQNYPNPFNPTTTIRFTVPSSNNGSNVKLVVYNILGKKVTTLFDKPNLSGTNEILFDASNLATGIYFYTLSTNGFLQTKKMILMK